MEPMLTIDSVRFDRLIENQVAAVESAKRNEEIKAALKRPQKTTNKES